MKKQLSFVPISLLTLSPGKPVPVDIYSWVHGADKPHLFLASDRILESDLLKNKPDDVELRLFIEPSSRSDFQQYLQRLVNDNDHIKTLNDERRSAIVSEVVRDVLANAFKSESTSTIVGTANLLGQHIASLVSETQLSMTGLSKILHHDYGTFTHSANVALYSSLLALRMGFDEYSIEDIAVGGLLHDIGKLSIEDRILNKAGKLDDMEFRIIKKHPLEGFRRLLSEENVTTCQLLMAYQHHEKLDGTGYPVGIESDEISKVAKLCAVVDVYEALTSKRPYRNAMRPEQAIEIMSRDVGKHLDGEILEIWKEFVFENEGALS
ncbi:MAG: HD-GYP domain-containing protein [Pirellula sp.]|jgi:HD-GYP domain-containing protein (c-di-GMP phosphodiesterase class II)|nr:HD domain-containing protein [Pirellula sp.]